ncbi:hypothetical protein LCGC14_2252730 [marine sediment metagenome]|uniref:Uncharacterized protein n=1 Tax=marine sediment metagenome TaxID=412755 RepID=A0A0F9D2D9_9ZZZZ
MNNNKSEKIKEKQAKKKEENKLEKSETKPFNLAKFEIIGDFFDSNTNYIENLRNQILNHNEAF